MGEGLGRSLCAACLNGAEMRIWVFPHPCFSYVGIIFVRPFGKFPYIGSHESGNV